MAPPLNLAPPHQCHHLPLSSSFELSCTDVAVQQRQTQRSTQTCVPVETQPSRETFLRGDLIAAPRPRMLYFRCDGICFLVLSGVTASAYFLNWLRKLGTLNSTSKGYLTVPITWLWGCYKPIVRSSCQCANGTFDIPCTYLWYKFVYKLISI